MDRFVLLARLKPNGRERARELLEERTTGGDAELAFQRRAIFLSESEVIFFFEGRDADKSCRAILDDPARSTAIGPWLPLFDGPLHRAPEAYFRERTDARPS